jgi:putative transposase
MSILTYKVEHNRNFATELHKAYSVAKFAIKHKSRSSKDVKFISLPSSISNQILKKYSNKKHKKVSNVKLTIPNQSIKIIKNDINIPCLKLTINDFIQYLPKDFIKINQIEIGGKSCYVSVEIPDENPKEFMNFIGIDRNTTGHCAVAAMPHNGKVIKLGKKAFHVHRKYKAIRRELQKKNAKLKLKKIRRREKNIINDINHKISKKIVDIAKRYKSNIALEDLTGIRKNSKGGKSKKINKNGESLKSSINSWEFYQLQTMIEYKSKICGIKIIYINPRYTSQKCSKCGNIGKREGKKFMCTNNNCNHVDHADSNAAFNIAKAALELNEIDNESNDQSPTDRDVGEGNTDIPQLETQRSECESMNEVA